MPSRTTVLGTLAGVLTLTSPAPAGAAITGSQITSPAASPSFVVYDQDTPSTLAVAGTTSGGNPAVDKVDLICVAGTQVADFQPAVPLNPDGSFSVPAGSLTSVLYQQCRLHAVPAGSVPDDLGAFRGPLLEVSYKRSFKVGSGPNADTNYNFYIWGQQPLGAFDYVSASSCGVDDGYLFDETLERTTTTFYCNAWYAPSEGGEAPGSRSQLRIDGADAYGPAAAENINNAASGLPATTFSFGQDPSTGNLAIQESSPLVKCPDAAFPPSSVSCPSFLPTGVRHDRTIVQDHQGRLTTIADSFVSVDGQAHQLDVLWQNYQRFYRDVGEGDATNVQYRFPGEPGFIVRGTGNVVSLPAGPGTILVEVAGAPDGDTSTGRGAIVYDRTAERATFNDVEVDSSGFYLHQAASVPAGGAAGFKFAYAQAYTSADAAALAAVASDRFVGPGVRITRPRNGKRTFRRSIVVRGIATDNGAVTALTVNGRPTDVGPSGRWSTRVRLARRGRHTIVARATDSGGNTAEARVRIRRTRACKVPRLRGRTLRQARRALRRSRCRLGKVRRRYSASVPAGRVVRSARRRGRLLQARTKVGVTLSLGPRQS